MNNNLSRRSWLRSSLVLASGAAVTPAAFGRSSIAPDQALLWSEQSRLKEIDYRLPAVLAPSVIRLNANENPFGPSAKARLAVIESAINGNRYAHGEAVKLKKMIAEREGVSEDYIMMGPGSTDLLEKVAITHFLEGGNIVSADPAYMSLVNTAKAFKATWKNVPLKKDWSHDVMAMEKAIDANTKLIYVCNPNNPTGSLTDAKELRNFCIKAADKAPVFVDEAYIDYLENPMASSMVDLVAKGKNVIVARTFSKIHGMAGLRIGYIVALPKTLEKIDSMVRGNMGMCITSVMGAIASMEDKEFQERSRKLTAEGRQFVCDELKKQGFNYVSSYTSFILFPIEMNGKEFLKKMMESGVAVRSFEIDAKTYCRVSVGLPDELKLFTESLKKVLA
ncbi:pyridoxal phosphate-dependent aminotransferase [Haliscomenobacter hydrossis]|uniref:Histidinol-phosphate transaminase n=1 Tax=Haliscomenobacter hydrossis (strain ATCC 27775 / DSM 1100 / LMG 10767 / O) TaxID=760192 RepID=F4L1A7_HALH1|nr:aminotransferase class I/II-fold pyridoxal phosphate-dependent enzyme [Haliscomenobacter hydrossis]AEE52839.1 Histidinol-phosphate transaminase [Haliscomenobacter hydrossis DSM 1100]